MHREWKHVVVWLFASLYVVYSGERHGWAVSSGTASQAYAIESFAPVYKGPVTENWGLILETDDDWIIFVDLCSVTMFSIEVDPSLPATKYRVEIQKLESVEPTDDYRKFVLLGVVVSKRVVLYVSNEVQRHAHWNYIYRQQLRDELGQPMERRCYPKRVASFLFRKVYSGKEFYLSIRLILL